MAIWRKLVIQRRDGQTQALVLENGKVVEYWPETSVEGQAGTIYKGRVTGWVPQNGACFIDLGLNKPAYMDWEGQNEGGAERGKDRGAWGQRPKRGEWLIVQIIREGDHLKGAKVTTNIKLVGRWLVYMPRGKGIKVSRRIEDPDTRQRLQDWATLWLADDEGLLFRTQAAQATPEQMLNELDHLRQKWQKVLDKANSHPGPILLDPNADFLGRLYNQFFNGDLKECVVDDPELYSFCQKMKESDPTLSFSLTLYEGKKKLFDHLGLTQEIDRLYEQKVMLSSGGYLVIEETDALTVIDVNTGGSLGRSELPDAAHVTNLEAAKEIARQIRLRNIGGIILIDFIPGQTAEEKRELLATLEQALKADRKETHVIGFTSLGLVEMTRKKTSASLWRKTTEPCPTCRARGRIRKNMA